MRDMHLSGLVLLCSLAGCVAAPVYNHPSKSLAGKQKDYVECAATANQAAQGSGGYFSDRAIRTAVFENARDQYLAMCLESRGWSAQPMASAATIATRNRSADYTAMRRCMQEALYSLRMYGGARDGSNSPAWQSAQKAYLASHEMPTDPPPSDEHLREILDRDLVARGLNMNWPVCLEASQREYTTSR
jgi:hypothetical protein